MSAAPEASAAPRARVRRWAAWAPGLEDREAWEAWTRAPQPVPVEGHPQARFLPAMLRRRCTPLTRIVLAAAFACVDEAQRGAVRTVFASRHGSINESIELLHAVVREERISPAKFSHTVHNAQAGLYCIAAGNRHASSSLAARDDTFACGWLEALGHLEREPTRPVLYVIGDVALEPTFAGLVEEPRGAYGLALLLAHPEADAEAAPGDAGPELAVDLGGRARPGGRPWPDALEFLRWLVADGAERALELGRFRFARA
ncbi:MAG: beta-ketoacyl synthase chain length factor [Myxococcota bacterium]|nr:beta-ketoacyl synthase chain length factor [Myxococcota bacterium]